MKNRKSITFIEIKYQYITKTRLYLQLQEIVSIEIKYNKITIRSHKINRI